MIVCETPECMEPSTTDAAGLCSRCARRPVKVKGPRLCGACYMRHSRYLDALEDEKKRARHRLDPWARLVQASKRHTRAVDLGWSERAVHSAEEQLRRAAEGFRRACKRERKATKARAA